MKLSIIRAVPDVVLTFIVSLSTAASNKPQIIRTGFVEINQQLKRFLYVDLIKCYGYTVSNPVYTTVCLKNHKATGLTYFVINPNH